MRYSMVVINWPNTTTRTRLRNISEQRFLRALLDHVHRNTVDGFLMTMWTKFCPNLPLTNGYGCDLLPSSDKNWRRLTMKRNKCVAILLNGSAPPLIDINPFPLPWLIWSFRRPPHTSYRVWTQLFGIQFECDVYKCDRALAPALSFTIASVVVIIYLESMC